MRILLFLLCLPLYLNAQSIVGNWQGSLTFQGQTARLVLKVQSENNNLTAVIDSPDQGAANIPVSAISVEENRVIFEVKSINGRFRGIFRSEDEIVGQWKQGAIELPLVLARIVQAPTLNRPQVEAVLAQNPMPYLAEEVQFRNGEIQLKGTLTLPKNRRGRIPAVVLVSGSGTQDRDESIIGHKPFLILADALTKAGYAVLRYDDRLLLPENEEINPNPDSRDFAQDLAAAIRYLKTRREIHRQKIGLIGHSEGAMLASMLLTQNPRNVAFVISMAGTGVDGTSILYSQVEAMFKSRKLDELIPQERAKQEKIYQILKTEPSDSAAVAQMKAVLTDFGVDVNGERAEMIEQELAQMTSRWFRYFLVHNPALDWKNVKVPVLLLNGERDLQVVPDLNLSALEAALRIAQNRKVTVKRFANLNHLFQTTPGTGHPEEYGKLEETLAPELLTEIIQWMRQNVRI